MFKKWRMLSRHTKSDLVCILCLYDGGFVKYICFLAEFVDCTCTLECDTSTSFQIITTRLSVWERSGPWPRFRIDTWGHESRVEFVSTFDLWQNRWSSNPKESHSLSALLFNVNTCFLAVFSVRKAPPCWISPCWIDDTLKIFLYQWCSFLYFPF